VEILVKTRAKGSAKELEYKKMKEAEGFVCEKTKASRFGNQDYFNLFDVMGFRGEEGFFAQVKSNQARDAVKFLKEFKLPKNIKKILAIKYDRGVGPKEWQGKWREIEIG